VAETKSNFLRAYKRPIPSIYNNVLIELLVQQHLMRYKRTYRYDPVFALGFVTVYDQLMEGYPSDEDRNAIFEAYIKALNEDPEHYRSGCLVFFSTSLFSIHNLHANSCRLSIASYLEIFTDPFEKKNPISFYIMEYLSLLLAGVCFLNCPLLQLLARCCRELTVFVQNLTH